MQWRQVTMECNVEAAVVKTLFTDTVGDTQTIVGQEEMVGQVAELDIPGAAPTAQRRGILPVLRVAMMCVTATTWSSSSPT